MLLGWGVACTDLSDQPARSGDSGSRERNSCDLVPRGVNHSGSTGCSNEAALAGARLEDAPGGAIAAQETKTVTVKSVDMNVPSVTVTADGRTLTRKVGDKKTLAGVKPGDQIDITYTQGLLLAAVSPKK